MNVRLDNFRPLYGHTDGVLFWLLWVVMLVRWGWYSTSTAVRCGGSMFPVEVVTIPTRRTEVTAAGCLVCFRWSLYTE